MAYLTLALFSGSMAHAAAFLPRVRYTRNGRMRFLRIGRIQTSFCICNRSL